MLAARLVVCVHPIRCPKQEAIPVDAEFSHPARQTILAVSQVASSGKRTEDSQARPVNPVAARPERSVPWKSYSDWDCSVRASGVRPASLPGVRRLRRGPEGRSIRKTVPSADVFSTTTSPPWSWTIFCTTVSPSPVPFSLPWLTNGSNSCPRMNSGIPRPLSLTRISTPFGLPSIPHQ